jgi:signal peptidase I
MKQTSLSSQSSGSNPGWGETIRTLVVAALIAIGFRSFIAEPFNIPSGSMVPTLLVGDYLFVSKSSYGYSRFSFPFGVAPISDRLFSEPPERGDVAVFRLPSDTAVDYIKRVVGLPGDKIQVISGVLHINEAPVTRRFVGNGLYKYGTRQIQTNLYMETLPGGGVPYMIQEVSDNELFDNTPVFTVPEKHYFMMGDNRDNSRDSRSRSVGFVPVANFIGEAKFLFFSHDNSASFWEVWKWPFSIRFSRIGSGII